MAAAGSQLHGQQTISFLAPTGSADVAKTDFTLEIAPITVELAPSRIISTIGYNGTAPGPLLRMKEGVPVTVNVVNKTDVPEFVHFHGQQVHRARGRAIRVRGESLGSHVGEGAIGVRSWIDEPAPTIGVARQRDNAVDRDGEFARRQIANLNRAIL